MQAMQMQHVRVSRGPQVPVPPVSTTPMEISRELQQQLRVTRHRAFERLQENAQWAKELLDGVQSTDDAFVTGGLTPSAEELQQQLEAKKQEVDELERRLAQQKEDEQATQRRFEEILTALKSAASVATLQECKEKMEAEKKLLSNKQRKMEIVRL